MEHLFQSLHLHFKSAKIKFAIFWSVFEKWIVTINGQNTSMTSPTVAFFFSQKEMNAENVLIVWDYPRDSLIFLGKPF